MAEGMIVRLPVDLSGEAGVRDGWSSGSEFSIRDKAQTAFNYTMYVADAQTAISVGRHEPGGDQGIRWSTHFRCEEFAHVLSKALDSLSPESPVTVYSRNDAIREAYTAPGVFYELADHLEHEIDEGETVESVDVTVGDQLVRWFDNPGHFLPRIEVRAPHVDPSVVKPVLGATACGSLFPQFETALNKLATV